LALWQLRSFHNNSQKRDKKRINNIELPNIKEIILDTWFYPGKQVHTGVRSFWQSFLLFIF
jgi:hypothetical protein